MKTGNPQDPGIRFLSDISFQIRPIKLIIIHFHLYPIQQILIFPDILGRRTRIKNEEYKKIKLILYATRMLKNLKKILCLCFILTSKLKNDA